MCLSQTEPRIVWTLLLNGILLGFDPETRERVSRVCNIITVILLVYIVLVFILYNGASLVSLSLSLSLVSVLISE